MSCDLSRDGEGCKKQKGLKGGKAAGGKLSPWSCRNCPRRRLIAVVDAKCQNRKENGRRGWASGARRRMRWTLGQSCVLFAFGWLLLALALWWLVGSWSILC